MAVIFSSFYTTRLIYKLTSDVEDDRLGDDADAVLPAADISARIGMADVGDDEHTATVILSATGRKRTRFLVPFQDDLTADQRLAAAPESHGRSDFGDLNLWLRHRQNDRRTGRRWSLLGVCNGRKGKTISDFRPRLRRRAQTDEKRDGHIEI